MKYKDIIGYSEPKKKLIKEKVEKPTLTEELTEEFGGLLLERRDLDPKIIKKIAKMTDRNDHLGARTFLSYQIEGHNRGNFFKYWNAASEINVVFGHTPPELNRLNQKMEKRLYKAIKQRFGNAGEIIGAL